MADEGNPPERADWARRDDRVDGDRPPGNRPLFMGIWCCWANEAKSDEYGEGFTGQSSDESGRISHGRRSSAGDGH